jgi:hypothetical protein
MDVRLGKKVDNPKEDGREVNKRVINKVDRRDVEEQVDEEFFQELIGVFSVECGKRSDPEVARQDRKEGGAEE